MWNLQIQVVNLVKRNCIYGGMGENQLAGRTWEISQACSIRLAKFEELSGESTADALTVAGERRIVVELGLIATKPSFVLLGDIHGFTIDFGTIRDSQQMQIAISSSSPRGLNNSAEIKKDFEIVFCVPNWRTVWGGEMP